VKRDYLIVVVPAASDLGATWSVVLLREPGGTFSEASRLSWVEEEDEAEAEEDWGAEAEADWEDSSWPLSWPWRWARNQMPTEMATPPRMRSSLADD